MILTDESATRDFGARLGRSARAGDVILLSGALGAGKTVIARGFLAARGHNGEVPSPSFAIVQPYDALSPPVVHVDLYRLEHARELDELGIDPGSDSILIVEWPERAGAKAWPDALHLLIEAVDDSSRCLTAKVPPSWEGRWPPR